MTPLGLAKKISKAFRILGYKTFVGQRTPHKGVAGEHYVRVFRTLGRDGDAEDQLGLITIDERDGLVRSYVEYDSDPELHDAYRALTAR